MPSFRAWVVREEGGRFGRRIEDRKTEDLPDGDVLIRVSFSSLNFKDALSFSGHRGVTKKYPHTPGVDAAGTVAESRDPRFKSNDEVLVTGYDLGMNVPGGFGQFIRVPAGWVVPKPAGLTLKECMIYGTAGFTAALSVMKLEAAGLAPSQGEVVVTGATGGVGSFAVAILAKAGYTVAAVTGKTTEKEYLTRLGARQIVSREEFITDSSKSLAPERWAGAVDCVGGQILVSVLKSLKRRASVAACGLTLSPELPMTVYPFILRGVNLLGIDSAEAPIDQKRAIWQKLASDWKVSQLSTIATESPIDQLESSIDRILKGNIKGRVIVSLK